MERESEELATWAAEVLNRGLLSENREEIRRAFLEWFVRYGAAGAVPVQITHPSDGPEETLIEFEGRHFEAGLTSRMEGAVSGLWGLIDLFEPHPAPTSPPTSHPAPTSPPADRVRTPAAGPAPPQGDRIEFNNGLFNGTVVGKQTYHTYALPGVVPTDPDRWPTVQETDPVRVGVRPTGRSGEHGGLPPYVRRDVDEGLRGWAAQGGLLVITGGPLTGKSRTAWAAVLHETDPHTRVYAPAPGTDLRGLPALLHDRDGTYVLWLDELEGHLVEHGPTLGLITELTALGVPVVATMGDDSYDEHRFGGGPASRVLTLARSERVRTRWSDQELGRLTALHDPRLDEARDRCGATSVTQYLAIGPELRAQWHRAGFSNSRHPYGHLLIRAATDLARCGVTGDIPRQLLEETCQSRGTGQAQWRLERESFQEALDWAVQPLHGVTGMLVPGVPRRVGESEDTWRPYGSLVVDAEQETERAVPDAVWRCALEGTKYDTGVHFNVRATAHVVFSARARDGDAGAMHMLSLLSENEATALDWLRKAVDAGKTELAGQVGERLLGQGEAEEALPYLRSAAERNPDGHETRLVGEAHLALAEQALSRAAHGGDMAAAHRLGDLLLGQGELSRASRHYTEAEAGGYAPVARSAAVYFLLRFEAELAEVLLTRAAASGDGKAARLLSDAQEPRQSLDDAAEYFNAGHPLDAAHHGAVLEKMGLLEQARTDYEQGCADGDAYAAYRLALLLDKQSNFSEATLWYRKAADMGHPGARKALAEHVEDTATVKE
ncbi:hypothetical protein [Streptomyces sp. NPDC060002]|uniref:hypothetical protein n=1 Tax=Streptomyces sp. NPDC060002 TaxID=3347033 RepID=UPI0036A12246